MKISSILKGAAGVIGTMNPALRAAIGVINTFLPDDKKLPVTANGDQALKAMEELPPNQRAQIMNSEIELEKTRIQSWSDIQKTLSVADAAGSSTRPKIAVIMAWTVVLSVVPFSAGLAYALFTGNTELMDRIDNSWPPLVAIIGTPTVLLRAYFGMRTNEKIARYSASIGSEPNQGLFSSIIKTLKK